MAKNKPSWDLNDLLNTVNEINVNEADQHGFVRWPNLSRLKMRNLEI